MSSLSNNNLIKIKTDIFNNRLCDLCLQKEAEKYKHQLVNINDLHALLTVPSRYRNGVICIDCFHFSLHYSIIAEKDINDHIKHYIEEAELLYDKKQLSLDDKDKTINYMEKLALHSMKRQLQEASVMLLNADVNNKQ
jgi:hypothetical protein